MKKLKKPNIEFIKEQYSQYHQIRRQVNNFSWQIPSIAFLALVFFIGLEKENIDFWLIYPIYPAIGLLIIGLFILVLLVFHIRNITFLRIFEKTLTKFEHEYGLDEKVYSHQLKNIKKLGWIQKIKSSSLLRYFLILLVLFAIAGSTYFWTKVFC